MKKKKLKRKLRAALRLVLELKENGDKVQSKLNELYKSTRGAEHDRSELKQWLRKLAVDRLGEGDRWHPNAPTGDMSNDDLYAGVLAGLEKLEAKVPPPRLRS